MEKVNRYIEVEGSEDFLVDLFPYKISNQENFYFRNHPENLNPKSFSHKKYWGIFKKRCLEGLWVNDNGTWVFMMPKLFFYINYVVISDEDRRRMSPSLMDNVWIMFTYFLCCEGFSGFEGDDKYTCNKYVGMLQRGEKLQPYELRKLESSEFLKNSKGEYKQYVEPWEYLTETYLINDNRGKPLGQALYENGYYHCMLLCARTTFKSFSVFMGLFLHEWLFGSARRIEDEKRTNDALLFGLASSQSDALSRSIGNLDRAYFSFPGQFDFPTKKKGKTVKYWGPFYKNTRGQWKVEKGSNEVRHLVKTKQGKTVINGSQCQIQTITPKNEKIFTGDRFRMGIIEEVGFCKNLKDIYIACKDAFTVGKNQVGSLILPGCVCKGTKIYTKSGEVKNIEDLVLHDGIVGYNGESSYGQDLSFLNPPQKKECVRITTLGGNYIECSVDHPLIKHKKYDVKVINKQKYKLCNYTEACNIEAGDYLLMSSEINIFGHTSYQDAYLYGLMLGDGHFNSMSVCVDDYEVKSFIENTYETNVKKNFKTKVGHDFWELTIKNSANIFGDLDTQGSLRDEKFISSNVSDFNKDSLANLIAGIFDSDGNVYDNKNKGTRIVLTNTSLELLKQTKYLLLKFGIECSIYKEKRNTEPSYEYRGQKDHIYRLYISNNLDVQKFKNLIPIKHSRKVKTLSNFSDGNKILKNSKFIFTHTGECIDESFITENSELKNVVAQKVKSVEFIGEKDVYNLNAKGSHNYIANGFITGNTGGDMDTIKDAKEMFENPEFFNIYGIPNYWERGKNKKCALMVGAYYKSVDLKENGNTLLKEALIDTIRYREKAIVEMDHVSFAKDLAFNPIYPKELLKPVNKSPLPIVELATQRENIIDMDVMSRLSVVGSLKYRNSKVVFEPDLENTLEPILEWGRDEKLTNNVGAWVIHEMPPVHIPEDLYYILYDPYAQSGEGTSLQAIYVYKYKFKNKGIDDSLEDTIVASYVGRLSDLDSSYEEAIKAAHFFNGKVFPELNNVGFAEYVDRKGLRGMMMHIPKKILEPIKGSTASSHGRSAYGFGIKTNEAMNIWAIHRLAQWLVNPTEKDEKTQIPTRFTYQKIRDLRFLSEAVNFVFENKVDYDAMSAMMLLPYLLSYLDGLEVEMPDQYETMMDLKYKYQPQRERRKVLVSKLSATI